MMKVNLLAAKRKRQLIIWVNCYGHLIDDIKSWVLVLYIATYLSTGWHGGALVEAITLNRRVVGSTPALAAM